MVDELVHLFSHISFEVFDEEEDGYIIVLDLFGFDLTKRSYKLREFEDSLSPIVSSYAMYLLGLDNEDELFDFLESETLSEFGALIASALAMGAVALTPLALAAGAASAGKAKAPKGNKKDEISDSEIMSV